MEEGVLVLGEQAFYHCEGITEIQIPDSVIFLMNNTFEGCTGLSSIRLPSSMSRIVNGAFIGCTGLKDVYYEGSQEEWEKMTEHFDIGLDKGTKIHYLLH